MNTGSFLVSSLGGRGGGGNLKLTGPAHVRTVDDSDKIIEAGGWFGFLRPGEQISEVRRERERERERERCT